MLESGTGCAGEGEKQRMYFEGMGEESVGGLRTGSLLQKYNHPILNRL